MKIKWKRASCSHGRKVLILAMKTSILLYCAVAFSFGTVSRGFSQNARIRIATDITLSVAQVFDLIQNQTNYEFVYRPDLIRDIPPVEIGKGEIKASDLLRMALPSGKYSYDFFDNTIVVKRKEAISVSPPEIQPIQIEGVVTGEDGLPLPGITVYVSNNEPVANKPVNRDFIVRGTSTDIDGKYTLMAEPGYFLVASSIGYEFTYQKITSGKTTYNIVLKEQISALDEVMVVGYGTTKKRDLTGSVGSMDADDIQQIKTQSVDQTLVGKIAGVHVQTRGGQPGQGAFVQIRGLSQIRGDNQPLYVVDGVPITITPNTESLGLINYGERENPLLAINPNDIERIDILKDASAAAIYGSRGANGVVIITTKRGKRNSEPRFSFNISTTIQNPVKTYDFLNASQYRDLTISQAQNTLNDYDESLWELYFPNEYGIVTDPDSYFGSANTDWQDMILNKNALWTQYNFSMSGGTEKVNYFTSISISDQEGTLIDNKFTRYSYSGNLDANVTDHFKIGASISYNYSKNRIGGFNNLYHAAFRPDLAAYNADGSYTTYMGSYGEQYTYFGNGKQSRNKAISKNMLGSVYGEINILDGLKFRSQINVAVNQDRTDNFSTSKSETALFEEMYYSRPGARLGVQTNNSWATNFTNTLNYNKTIFEDHTIDAVVGVSWDRTRYDAESQNYRGFPDDDILTDINSASFFDSAESESLEQGLNSLFGRVNYNYKNRYLATFTARRDGSTKFGPDNRYGFFPSGALAWNMHNERFMEKFDQIDQLKLRASIGRVGSDNLPSFTYLAYYQALENNDSFYDGQNGIAVTGVPNTGIRWESTDQLDLGLEFDLFNHRLNGEIVYYEKNTSGIILFTPIPSETGATSWNTNIADVSNRGWEITVGGDIFRNQDFRWNSSINFSTLKNNVDQLYGADAGTQTGIIEGQPIGVITGYDVIKIAQSQDEIDELNSAAGGLYQESLTQEGDYIFRDIDGDGKITTDDRGPIGNPNPDFFGGWINQLSYKNWDFTMNWNFVHGTERQYDQISSLYYLQTNSNTTTLALDTWTPDYRNAPYARYGSPSHGYTPTSRSVVDASYIKLRSVSVSYNLPKEWLSKFGVSNTRLTLSGNNLITITDYPGLDPEDVVTTGFANRSTNFNADGGLSYPNSRNFTFSLNIAF
ncbi:SusC/RagA family TonB-linked outer membrane protein [Sinomicrobium sp.]